MGDSSLYDLWSCEGQTNSFPVLSAWDVLGAATNVIPLNLNRATVRVVCLCVCLWLSLSSFQETEAVSPSAGDSHCLCSSCWDTCPLCSPCPCPASEVCLSHHVSQVAYFRDPPLYLTAHTQPHGSGASLQPARFLQAAHSGNIGRFYFLFFQIFQNTALHTVYASTFQPTSLRQKPRASGYLGVCIVVWAHLSIRVQR